MQAATFGGVSAKVSFEASPAPGSQDLVAEVADGLLGPLTEREREPNQVLQILSPRTKNGAVLVGESGVGKNSLVYGVARRLAEENVPDVLMERAIVRTDSADIARACGPTRTGSHSLLRGRSRKGGKLRLMAPDAALFPLGMEKDDELARSFEAVTVLTPGEEDAARGRRILGGFEKFHGVAISPEAIQIAISASARFLRHRPHPTAPLT